MPKTFYVLDEIREVVKSFCVVNESNTFYSLKSFAEAQKATGIITRILHL